MTPHMRTAVRAFHRKLVSAIENANAIAANAPCRRDCEAAAAQRDDLVDELTRHNTAFQEAGIVRPLAIVRRDHG